MRDFCIILDEARTDSDFSVKGLSSNGRMDIGCRFINSALFNSYSLREDVNVHLILRGPPNSCVHMEFIGEKISGLHPGERDIAGYIKKNLGSFENRGVSANVGVRIDRRDIGEILEDADGVPFILHEDGEDVSDLKIGSKPFFVVGDHKGFSETDIDLFDSRDYEHMSLGEIPYQAQQICSFLNIYIDRL